MTAEVWQPWEGGIAQPLMLVGQVGAAHMPSQQPAANPTPHLEDLQQGGEGGVDNTVQRPPLLLVPKLVLAGQEAQHVQRAADARLVLRQCSNRWN